MNAGIVTRIAHNTDARICFLEICGVTYLFIAGAFGSRLELLTGVSDVPRLVIPMAAVMLVFLLRNAYRRSKESDYANAVIDMVLAMTAAVLSQILLTYVIPDWKMPRWAPTQGGYVGSLFVTLVRTLFPQGPKGQPANASSSHGQDEIQWLASEFTQQVSKRNVATLIVSSIAVAASIWGFAHTETLRLRIAFSGFSLFALAIFLGSITIGATKAAFVQSSPEVFRTELKRQHRFLKWVFYGYVGLLLPATVVFLMGTHVYEFVVIVYMLLFAELILRKSEAYHGQFRVVESLEFDRATSRSDG